MVTVYYRRWCPPQSPLRIEFPPELLREVRLEGREPALPLPRRWRPLFNRAVNQSSGLLFGVQHEDEVRVVTARARPGDAIPDGLTPVGTYVCRARGEVFLTDDDLANFERHHSVLALVVAGGQAGFFVREPDGSVQAIRSHEEFPVADAAAKPASARASAVAELPSPAPRGRQQHIWKRAAACAGLLAIPAGGFAYLRPLLPRLPIALAIREEAGQLRIGWNAAALTEGSRLEISDGSERSILMLEANTSGATYGPQGRDVEVRLSTGTRVGGARWEAARFVREAPRRTTPGSSTLLDQIGALTREAQSLRRTLANGHAKAQQLAAKMDAIAAKP
jgi:hypothetical protein